MLIIQQLENFVIYCDYKIFTYEMYVISIIMWFTNCFYTEIFYFYININYDLIDQKNNYIYNVVNT